MVTRGSLTLIVMTFGIINVAGVNNKVAFATGEHCSPVAAMAAVIAAEDERKGVGKLLIGIGLRLEDVGVLNAN